MWLRQQASRKWLAGECGVTLGGTAISYKKSRYSQGNSRHATLPSILIMKAWFGMHRDENRGTGRSRETRNRGAG